MTATEPAVPEKDSSEFSQSAGDFLANAAEIGAGVLTAAALVALLLAAYRRSLGRRRIAKRKLGRLSTSVRVDYFEGILGAAAFKTTEGGESTFIFVDPLFFVMAHAAEVDGTVIWYSVTTRSRKFRPLAIGPHPIRLGKSRFSDLRNDPTAAGSFLGARRWGYSEVHYEGNPGMYQTFGYGHCQSGAGVQVGSIQEIAWDDGPLASSPIADDFSHDPRLKRFRDESVINSYAVGAPYFDLQPDPGGFGPDEDLVRVLYWGQPHRAMRKRLRRHRWRTFTRRLQARATSYIKRQARRVAPRMYLRLWQTKEWIKRR